MKKALYFKPSGKNESGVQCLLCPHLCNIAEGKMGICGTRKNLNGQLYSLTYNEFTSLHLDPIEKKPLYHFYPGSSIISVGNVGCNFRCKFCQNWEISQAKHGDIGARKLTSSDVLKIAQDNNSSGIAFTYNEPLINYEWVLETAKLFNENGLKNVIISNGYINREPLEKLLPFIDAANIDVKSFKDDFYKRICGAALPPVLETVKMLVSEKKHIEITNLVIPGLNDSTDGIEGLTSWLANLDEYIPLHFSRYFPQYQMDIASTEMDTLIKAFEIAIKKLKHVYIGNVSDDRYNATKCPTCDSILIERYGYNARLSGINKAGICLKCGNKTRIVL